MVIFALICLNALLINPHSSVSSHAVQNYQFYFHHPTFAWALISIGTCVCVCLYVSECVSGGWGPPVSFLPKVKLSDNAECASPAPNQDSDVSSHLFETPGFTSPNISTRKRTSCKSCRPFHFRPSTFPNGEKSLALGTGWGQFTRAPPSEIAFMMWFETSLYFGDFFSPTTHTSVISLLSTASSENWGSEEHNREGPVLWSSFFVALTAHSGSLGNGQCSELECLDGADIQFCGLRNKCFYGFGKQRLILGFEIPFVSFFF